jgi:predicted nucleic acid-binding protein
VRKAFVDTNLFLRYLTNDDPEKADRVSHLLDDAAAGQVALVTTEMVLAEVVWVLESSYRLGNAEVSPLIRGILATPGLQVINGSLVARAVEIYESQNVDFVDAYVAAVMERDGIEEVYSFDRKHLSRPKAVRRKEP